MARTTIPLTPETRDRLKALGKKGETYDALLNRLLDHYLGAPGGGTTQAPPRPSEDAVDFERV